MVPAVKEKVPNFAEIGAYIKSSANLKRHHPLTNNISKPTIMAKSESQIRNFLMGSCFYSRTDWNMIASFCKDKADLDFIVEFNPENGIKASDFAQWYEDGFGCGDIVEFDGKIGIIGKSDLNAPTIVANLSDDKILISPLQIASERIKMAKNANIDKFNKLMMQERLRFDHKSGSICPRYVPSPDDRVVFEGCGKRGLGVIRDIDHTSGSITLYCYFIYTTNECGYSMHEEGICNLNDYVFEPMNEDDDRLTSANGRACQRRLNTELERYGKRWNQNRHRIEPLEMQVEPGKRYWYINDKMVIVQAYEKNNYLGRERALGGNYFKTAADAAEAREKINDVIRDILARPEKKVVKKKKG